jgi:hypothetical protein
MEVPRFLAAAVRIASIGMTTVPAPANPARETYTTDKLAQ